MTRISLILLLCFAPIGLAAAQENAALLDRLERMERDMQTMQLEVFRSEKPLPASTPQSLRRDNIEDSAVGSLHAKISELENSLRELTGRIEELSHQQNLAKQIQEKSQSDIEFRLQALESKLQAAAQPLAATHAEPLMEPAAGVNATAPAEDSERQIHDKYDAALNLLQQTDYAGAEAAFKSWIASYPKHALAGNAQYWLAESYYVRGAYPEAAVEFLLAYQNYPKGNKQADSLLKLGLSLSQLNNKKEACSTFAKLRREFPKAPQNIQTRRAGEEAKLECAKAGA